MRYEGVIHRFGDHIDTDVIIPATYMTVDDPAHWARHCFEPLAADFAARVTPGDLVFAGENFGCGSSREHAPIAIKAAGISCVVAASFARIFYRSAINIGLPAVVCPAAVAAAKDGMRAVVDLEAGTVRVGDQQYAIAPFSPEVLAIIEAGGLVASMKKKWMARQTEMHP